MQGRGSAMRGDATTSRRIDERQRRDERQREAEAVQGEETGHPAGEDERRMGGRKQRLCIKRQ
jgi:hypothetical protein